MTTLGNCLRAVVDHIETNVAGINKGYYPFPNQIEQADVPCVVAEPRTADIDEDIAGTEQTWTTQARLILLYPRTTDTAEEFNRVNDLVEPVVDALSLGTTHRNIHQLIPALEGKVYRIKPSAVVYSQQFTYGTEYACAYVDLEIKLHRRPGDA